MNHDKFLYVLTRQWQSNKFFSDGRHKRVKKIEMRELKANKMKLYKNNIVERNFKNRKEMLEKCSTGVEVDLMSVDRKLHGNWENLRD